MAHPVRTCALLMFGVLATPASADTPSPGKVNDSCSQMTCESGLFCVETRDGKKKCSSCDQSKLGSYTNAVEDSCKGFGSGWTPESSADYQAALASDKRVLVDVFDTMLASAKKCRDARQSREKDCWGGGDSDHRRAID